MIYLKEPNGSLFVIPSQLPQCQAGQWQETFTFAMKAVFQLSEIQNEFFRKSSKRLMSRWFVLFPCGL